MRKVFDLGVNIYFKILLHRILLLFLLTAMWINSHAEIHAKDPLKNVLEKLGAGVNLSHFEKYWAPYETTMAADLTPKLESIRAAGFSTVRLPVHFDMFLEDGQRFKEEFLIKIGNIYQTCIAKKLKLIIVYHYGKIQNNNTDAETARVIQLWTQLTRLFKGSGYEDLFFELYNEPTMDVWLWKYVINSMYPPLRREDPNRIFIVGGSNYNGISELLHLGKLDDNRILYTFHFYEPYIFTHQGAEWTKEKTYITGFPYPYKKRKMPELYYAPDGAQMEKDYQRYYREADPAYLEAKIGSALKECQQRGMPLICTEFGVIKGAPRKAKNNYLTDLTKILTNLHIPAMVWDYDDRFTITEEDGDLLSPIKKWIQKN